MNRITSAILFLVIFTFINCGDCKICDHAWFLTVKNNTDQKIFVFYQHNYPDTTLSREKPIMDFFHSHSEGEIERSGILEQEINYNNDYDIITFFVINKDSLAKQGWEYMRENYIVYRRMEYSYQDIVDINGIIVIE